VYPNFQYDVNTYYFCWFTPTFTWLVVTILPNLLLFSLCILVAGAGIKPGTFWIPHKYTKHKMWCYQLLNWIIVGTLRIHSYPNFIGSQFLSSETGIKPAELQHVILMLMRLLQLFYLHKYLFNTKTYGIC
jgi:hypothetical protein